MSKEYWDKNDELGLVKYVNFAKESEAVEDFLKQAREKSLLPASGYDFNPGRGDPRELIENIYNALCQQNIEYDLNEYIQYWKDEQQQKILTAEDIFQRQGKGTCLDLAILFCAICIHFNLLPILILLDGHALAAVSLTHSYRDWENESRNGQELFWENLGTLKNKNGLKKMLKKEYLAVECTGFARSETISETGDFEREDRLLSFEQAVEAGEQIVKQKEKDLFFALDIPTAYNFWFPKVFGERLEREVPKSFNNDKDLLKDIYVPLGLIERKRKEQAKRRPDEDSVNPENAEFNKPDEKYEIVKEYKNDEFFDEVLKNSVSTNSQGKRLLVVGDPGGGKSTLLQKIADWILEKELGLPIWISLAKFNEDLVKDKDVSDAGWLYRYLSEQWVRNLSQEGRNTPEKWDNKFEELYKTRQLWLLLDGADEMAVSYPLKKIQEQLAKGWTNSVRVVLSCRLNLWEQQKDTLNEKFDVYRTLDFNYPEQVHQFIDNWFKEEDEQGKKLQQQLEEKNRERLQNLVQNPLRLSLLCRIWNDGCGKLPETKAGFYQLLVDNHYKWKDDAKQEFKIPSDIQKKLNKALGELAREAIDNSNFRFRLRESFIRNNLGDPNNKESLFSWALKLGWLLDIGYPTEEETNRGEKVYAFFHPTFQEYFAATAVKDYYFFLPKEHKDRLQDPEKNEYKPYRVFEPQWKEVILLWLGRTDVKDKVKKEFIDKLTNFEDEVEKFYYYRAYCLAAAGIAEFEDYSQKDKIVRQIADWSLDYSSTQKWLRKKLPRAIQNLATATLKETERKTAIDALVGLLSQPNLDGYTRRDVADVLGRIGTGNQKAIDALVQLLCQADLDDDICWDDICWEVADVLEQIGTGNQTAIDTLVELLCQADLDDYIRWELVANTLKHIGTGNRKAIDALVELLCQANLDNSTRREVANTLGLIGTGDRKAIDALVRLLSQPNLNNSTRWQVADVLGQIGTGDRTAIEALVRLLSQPNLNNSTRRQVAESLGLIGTGDRTAIEALVRLLSQPNLNNFTRWKVANTLGQIGIGDRTAIDALVGLLDQPNLDNFTSREVAESLGQIGIGDRTAIDALVQLLCQADLDNFTSREVVQSLGLIGTGDRTAIDALVRLLSQPNLDDYTYWQVVESLGLIGTGNQNALKVVKISKTYFNNCQEFSHNTLFNVIWRFSENLPYPEFYQAWHANRTTQSLDLANLPQILTEEIAKDPNLRDKLQLICIDGSKFINLDNPAIDIYEQILDLDYPERENGEVDTMQKLKSYWNSLRRKSDCNFVLVFYENPTKRQRKGFSEVFLDALDTFDGAICLITEQLLENNELKFFDTNQSTKDVVEWIIQSCRMNR